MKTILLKALICGAVILSARATAQPAHQFSPESRKPPSEKTKTFTEGSKQAPVIPTGADAYLMWDKWPFQRIGVRTYMRSTYDRAGGNEGADAAHFLFMKQEEENVTLDVAGKGMLYFFRANHWHGSPWHFVVDNKDHIVKETGTSDPVNATKVFSTTQFIPGKPFPEPLAYTWSATKGADLIWTPIPFKRSLQIAYSRTHYGTGYYIYDLYAADAPLSRPVSSWDENKPADKKVQDLINRSGTDIAPKNIKKKTGILNLGKGERLLITDIRSSPSVIRALKFSLPLDKAIELERLRLLVTWDDAPYPSIDAPLCLFFGAGSFYNRDEKEFLVKGFPINVRYDYMNKKVELACYYPMPFFRSAKFELAGINADSTEIKYEIRYEPYRGAANQSSYFHATYRDFPDPDPVRKDSFGGKDLTLLDTRGEEGHSQWSGNFAGTSFIFSHNGNLNTLEGDPRFFFDDSQTPQGQGTGTEEWGGGGDYWGGENMTLPFAGHPCGTRKKELAKENKDLIESAYRFLLADLMPFGSRAVIRLEHGGDNQSKEHYETVTYWYGLPAPSLVKTDEINIGDTGSEREHAYYSPQSSPVESVTSRYEWGVDSMYQEKGNGKEKIEVYPAHTEDGRHTTGISEFTIKLDRNNLGVLLRRTLDYSFPNQKAEVYVADAGGEKQTGKSPWKYAGTWYLAGSNTCVYSNPPGELDKRLYKVETSDRRFRDDEFLLPGTLTRRRKAIRVRIKFVPVQQELYPGMPFPKAGAWSELRYTVYSYMMPDFPIKR